MKKSDKTKWFAWSICLLIGFILGIKCLIDADFWWMLRTGEYILQNKQIPYYDTFSFTFNNTKWINIKWLYEVLIYLVYKIAGIETIPIIQSFSNLLIIFLIYKTSLKLNQGLNENQENYPTIGIILATYIALFCSEYRMVGRPEMTSHLMVLLFTFKFLSYRLKPSKSIYWIILFQILWTNLHEGYGIGIVICSIMMFSGILEYYFFSNKKENYLKHLIISSLLAIFSIGINPYGLYIIVHSQNIFTQLQENKFTTELHSFETKTYWENFEAYISLTIFITVLLCILSIKSNKNIKIWCLSVFKNFGVGLLLLFFLFFYLSLTAYRNIAIFILFSAPLLAVFIDTLIVKIKRSKRVNYESFLKRTYIFLIIAGVIFYVGIGSNYYYKYFNKNNNYGLKLLSSSNPSKLIEFIKSNNIKGKCFSDFTASSYLLWELRPDFKCYIDFRDLDVYSLEFYKNFMSLLNDPGKIIQIDSIYNFDYIVLDNKFIPLHKFLFQSKNWALVYVDDLAGVFIRTDKKNADIINKYALNKERKDIYQMHTPLKSSSTAYLISKIFWPFYDEGKNNRYNYDLLAANYYMQIGYSEGALLKAKVASKNKYEKDKAFSIIGNTYYMAGINESEINKRISFYNLSKNALLRCLRINENNEQCRKGLGFIEYKMNNWQKADEHLSSVIENDKTDSEVYILLANCQIHLSKIYPQNNLKYKEKWLRYLTKASELEPNNSNIKFTLGIEYCKESNCELAKKYLNEVSLSMKLNNEDIQLLNKCKRLCKLK